MTCDIFSHAINRTENKGNEIEKKIHIDLAVIASQWSELAVHDSTVFIIGEQVETYCPPFSFNISSFPYTTLLFLSTGLPVIQF